MGLRDSCEGKGGARRAREFRVASDARAFRVPSRTRGDATGRDARDANARGRRGDSTHLARVRSRGDVLAQARERRAEPEAPTLARGRRRTADHAHAGVPRGMSTRRGGRRRRDHASLARPRTAEPIPRARIARGGARTCRALRGSCGGARRACVGPSREKRPGCRFFPPRSSLFDVRHGVRLGREFPLGLALEVAAIRLDDRRASSPLSWRRRPYRARERRSSAPLTRVGRVVGAGCRLVRRRPARRRTMPGPPACGGDA